MKTRTLKRGLVNYFDQDGEFHKCFAVSNGESFVFWFGGIFIANEFIQATFEESDEISLHHYGIVYPESIEYYKAMEKHFDLCLSLSTMAYPAEFEAIGFRDSEHMMDIPDFGEDFERMHVFHHQQDEGIHAVFGDPLDGEYGFIQLLLGVLEGASQEYRQMEKEWESYKDLKEASGSVLKNLCGFNIPKETTETAVFHDFDGGISQLLQDRHGIVHIFHRDGNDHFTYCEPLDKWFEDHKGWLVSRQQEYAKKAQGLQQVINKAFLKC